MKFAGLPMDNVEYDASRWDGRSEDGRRKPRGSTVKRVEGVPRRIQKPQPAKPTAVEPPTDEQLLLLWLFERIDRKIVALDRAIAKNVCRSNVAGLLHGRCESESGVMTLTELATYAADHEDDVDLEIVRAERAPRAYSVGWANRTG
jgi:hypothetical protein